MKRWAMRVITLSVVVWASGCNPYRVNEGSYSPVNVRDANAPGAQIRWNNVALLDQSIANKIATEATNTRRTATNTVEVWATLRNRTDFSIQLEARTSFYDVNQGPLEGPSSWQRLFLPPNGTVSYSEFSTRTDVGYYTIEVREGR